jgi:hypothetical protein
MIMFADCSKSQKVIVYQAFIQAIESNSGIGFANRDQRHPAYAMGARGIVDEPRWGDSPQNNDLYQMITALEPDVRDEVGILITSWVDFCSFAIKAAE